MLVREAHRLRRDSMMSACFVIAQNGSIARRLEVRDRCLGAQLRPHRVRIAVAREPLGIDEIEGIDGWRCTGHGNTGQVTLRGIGTLERLTRRRRDGSLQEADDAVDEVAERDRERQQQLAGRRGRVHGRRRRAR